MIEQHLERHRRRGLIYSLGICNGNYADAQDLVQDASIRAWQGWPAKHLEWGFWPWFERIILNCWLDKRKSMVDGPWIPRYRDERPEPVPQLISLEALMEWGWDVGDIPDLTGAEKKKVDQALGGLTRRQRQCLSLVRQGYSYQEISEYLHIAYSTICNHASAGLNRLKEETANG